MPFGWLRVAYVGEFNSWKAPQGILQEAEACLAVGPIVESFKGFLLSMKPMPGPGYTLDRNDPAVHAYGPGICKWKTITEQNNNKSDNVQLVVPLTGRRLTPKKIAELRNVSVKTVYKWISQHWSVLELLAGKQSPPLHALWVKLDELPTSSPASKTPSNPLKLPPFHERHPGQEWPFYEADVLHEEMTGEQIDTEYVARRADYDSIAAWIAIVNAGLPVPALPELKVLSSAPDPGEDSPNLRQTRQTVAQAEGNSLRYWLRT